MSENARTVTPVAQLAQALADKAPTIVVDGEISGAPEITLPPGTALRGGVLKFGAKGVRLTRDNLLEDSRIKTSETEAAIVNDTNVKDFGTLSLSSVTTIGQIALLAEDRVRAGHVQAEGVHVTAADVRGRFHRPHGFGVEALQGTFTVWNRQADPHTRLTAELFNISAGTKDAPVRGSGVSSPVTATGTVNPTAAQLS